MMSTDKTKLLIAIFVLFYSATTFAGKLDPVLVVHSGELKSGEAIEFFLYLHNSENEALHVDLPAKIICRLKTTEQMIEVPARSMLAKTSKTVIIPAGGFFKIPYEFTIPTSLVGMVTMEVTFFEAAPVIFAVKDGPSPAQDKEIVKSETTETPRYRSFDSMFSLYQPYLSNISAYEPMYFLFGTDPKDSKFQISFKYRFFNPYGSLAHKYPWIKGFHFAYTQTSFWDLQSASLPFEDTSYKPELFFQSTNIDLKTLGVQGFFPQTGFQHESNGRGGEASRSTNFIYAKPIFILYNESSQLGMQIAPKVWAYVANEEENNPDLPDYRGYFELELKFGKADSFVLGSYLRWAQKGGSIQLDLTYPLTRILFGNIDIYLQAQYVSALAESLIHYKERTEALRFGFAIVR